MVGDQELKVWAAIASYMASFEDTDDDGIGNVPAKYAQWEGRKVVEDSKNLFDLVNNPNKFSIAITSIILILLLLVVVFIRAIAKTIRKFSNKNKHK